MRKLSVAGWTIVVLVLACLALGGVLWRDHRANYPTWYSGLARLHDPDFAASQGSDHEVLTLACQSPFAQLQAKSGHPIIYAQVVFDINVKTGRWYPIRVLTSPPDFRCPTK